MNALRMAQYQRQFDSCCGKVPKKALPLTGLERMRLEAVEEQQQAALMWMELDSRKDG